MFRIPMFKINKVGVNICELVPTDTQIAECRLTFVANLKFTA